MPNSVFNVIGGNLLVALVVLYVVTLLLKFEENFKKKSQLGSFVLGDGHNSGVLLNGFLLPHHSVSLHPSLIARLLLTSFVGFLSLIYRYNLLSVSKEIPVSMSRGLPVPARSRSISSLHFCFSYEQ